MHDVIICSKNSPLERYAASGFSMEPFILDGDEILIKCLPPASYRIGDILLYQSRSEDRLIAHRLIQIKNGGRFFIFRADALPSFKESVPVDAVLGKVYHARRKALLINLSSKGGFDFLSRWWIVYGYGRLLFLKDTVTQRLLPLITRLQSFYFYRQIATRLWRPVFEFHQTQEEDHYHAVVKINGCLAGQADLHVESGKAASILWITSLSVRIRYRGAGIGKTLLQEIESFAKQKDIRELGLTLERDNLQARGLYQKTGFEDFKDADVSESRIVLRKSLTRTR